MFGFVCFGAGAATAKDYQTLCLTRFFQGLMGACPISLTTSTYADMYNVYHRGYATTVFVSWTSPSIAIPIDKDEIFAGSCGSKLTGICLGVHGL